MTAFSIEVDIAALPARVWSVIADVERWHEWTESIRGVRLLDKGPLRIGSRAFIRQPRFPAAVWKVTELDPGRSFTWRTGAPGMWAYGRHSVDAIAGGTRATLRLHYEGALGRLLARMTQGITNRYLGFEAAGLKKRSEQRAQASNHFHH
jgi:uncharacterized protein YndB with AHSA1/START domain